MTAGYPNSLWKNPRITLEYLQNTYTNNAKAILVSKNHIIHQNDSKIREYIDSVCVDMFSSWEPKLLMDVYILSQKCKDYNIIKHINEDISYFIYFDPSKYLVKDGYDGDGYALLCNDIATTAIKEGFHIIRNGYYNIRGSTAQRFSCNRCVLYKGDVKH